MLTPIQKAGTVLTNGIKAVDYVALQRSWDNTDPRHTASYIKDYWKQFEPFTDGWYTNEVDDHADSTVNSNYQGNYERLVRVKNRYDPTKLFRLNANVKPTA